MGGADCDHGFGVARIRDAHGPVALFLFSSAGRVQGATLVSRGRDYDHAVTDETSTLLAHRTPAAGIVAHLMMHGEAQVDSVNLELFMSLIEAPDELQR